MTGNLMQYDHDSILKSSSPHLYSIFVPKAEDMRCSHWITIFIIPTPLWNDFFSEQLFVASVFPAPALDTHIIHSDFQHGAVRLRRAAGQTKLRERGRRSRSWRRRSRHLMRAEEFRDRVHPGDTQHQRLLQIYFISRSPLKGRGNIKVISKYSLLN